MVKRRDLVRELEKAGFTSRQGSNHEVYQKGNLKTVVPRHREIPEITANYIRKQAGLK